MKNIPVPEVLAWLQANHPALHESAVIDRAWTWLVFDLRGDHNKPARESLKEFGFRFAKKGHALPDGRIAYWAHSGMKPLPFRKGGFKKPTPDQGVIYQTSEWDRVRLEVARELGELQTT